MGMPTQDFRRLENIMNTKTEKQIENLKNQTIGVEIETQADSEISSHERLTFSGLRRREKYDLLIFPEHKEQIGPQTSEGLLHHVVLILAHYDRSLIGGFMTTQGQFAQNRNIRQLLHIATILDLIFQ